MRTTGKPWWQQVTALVSVSTSGAITGLSFAPHAPADVASPTSTPIHLLALDHAARQDPGDDTALRTAIVNVARYYLQLARTRTPAEMEALIWRQDSLDGADHGPSCAAFASLTLELGAQAVGRHSWVTGGTSYPWPLHQWADVRVDPNPASPGIVSILQDAEAHHRWHPLGDGYRPQPGDWVLFDGHVEVVTADTNGVLSTIGGDSLPNFSVNAHEYPAPLAAHGIVGFVDNGLTPATTATGPSASAVAAAHHTSTARTAATDASAAVPGVPTPAAGTTSTADAPAIPGLPGGTAAGPEASGPSAPAAHPVDQRQSAARPPAASPDPIAAEVAPAAAAATTTTAAIPGLADPPFPGAPKPAEPSASDAAGRQTSNAAQAVPSPQPQTGSNDVPLSTAQRAFIDTVAPAAVAEGRVYRVPPSVTIAQAIVESGWGESELAVKAHNLFGMKGTGPAGSIQLPTVEYENGQWVMMTAPFRVYHDVAESVADHDRLLATDPSYRLAMANRDDPDAFAAALTGVYATDPDYGTKLVTLMRQYDLYRFDSASVGAQPRSVTASTPPAETDPASSRAPGGGPSASETAHRAGHVNGAPPAAPPRTTPPAFPSGTVPVPGLPQRQPPLGTVTSPTGAGQSASDGPIGVPANDPVTPYTGGTPSPSPTATGSTMEGTAWYRPRIPAPVRKAILTVAYTPLTRGEPLYRDVAAGHGIRWELLAACDWMQCEAHPRRSPVYGEKLGTVNPDGTVYRTKSAALDQCAQDLVDLAFAVYGIDLTCDRVLSVRELADVFAAFRWGGLLKRHRTSAMEFPYSVAGLTERHLRMRWPDVDEPDAPDRPGTRFRRPFGAVPLVLCLDYPATV